MKPIKYSLLVVAIAAAASVVIGAEEKEKAAAGGMTAGEHHKIYNAETTEWGDGPPFFPEGVKFAVLSGDPGKEGVYTVRLQAPAGYKIPAHTHPGDELITVISGALHLGMGDKLDESKADTIAAGSFTNMPAGTKHYAFFTEETVLQVHGYGPFGITYVNPADDPRNAKK